MTKSFSILLLVALACGLWSAETAERDLGGPVSTVHVIAPLSLADAQNWTLYSQVIPVKEKDGIVIDTAANKGQIMLVHSISYFKGSSGQLYAVVNFLRPRQ